MLVALIVIVLSVFGIWLLSRCAPPVEEWDDWPADDFRDMTCGEEMYDAEE